MRGSSGWMSLCLTRWKRPMIRGCLLILINGLQILFFCASGAHVRNVRCAPVLEKQHFRRISLHYQIASKICDICFLTALLRYSRGLTTPRSLRLVRKQISLIFMGKWVLSYHRHPVGTRSVLKQTGSSDVASFACVFVDPCCLNAAMLRRGDGVEGVL